MPGVRPTFDKFLFLPPKHHFMALVPIKKPCQSAGRQLPTFFCFCVLLLLASGCKQAATYKETNRIFSEYFVRYLESERQIKAYATFFEGDSMATAVPKTFLGGVTFQGSAMEPRNLLDKATRYTITQNGDYSSAFEFKYKNEQREEQHHIITMSPLQNLTIDSLISKSSNLKLRVQGGELSAEESLVLLFNDENNKASSITITGPTQGTEHLIPASNLKGLSTGKCQLYLVKKRGEIKESSDSHTVSAIEFYTNTVEVEVVE